VPSASPLPKAAVPELVERTFATAKPQVTGLFIAPIVNQFLYGITVPVWRREPLRPREVARSLAVQPPSQRLRKISTSQRVWSQQMNCRQVGWRWSPMLRTASSHGPSRGMPSSASSCHPRSGFAQDPAAYSSLPTPKAIMAAGIRAVGFAGWEIAAWAPKTLPEAQALWWTIATASLAFMLAVAVASWLERIIASSVSLRLALRLLRRKATRCCRTQHPSSMVNTLTAELRERTDSLRES
jgi:hypothetical protein